MKGVLRILAALLLGQMSMVAAAEDKGVSVMTFNIRCDTPKDNENGWQYRRDRAANAIKFYDVDIVGTQEVRHNQLVDMAERLPGYVQVGVGRADGKEKGEYCAIWYKKDRFTQLDSGNFWLSETPDVAGSRGWDGYCERVASWVKLRDNASGKEFMMLNTHLDHRGKVARREAAALLLTKVQELAGSLPVVVTGDFNAVAADEPIKVLTDKSNPLALTDSRSVSELIYGPAWTWHNYGRIPYEKRELIDYVFVKGPVKVSRYGVLAETENKEFLSDHAPIMVNLIFE